MIVINVRLLAWLTGPGGFQPIEHVSTAAAAAAGEFHRDQEVC